MSAWELYGAFLAGIIKPATVVLVLVLVVNMLRDAISTHADPSD